MAFTEKIRVLFEVNDKAAVGSFGNITRSVKEADGANGKMRAGLGATSSFLKENLVGAASAAATAVIAFGVSAVSKFQDTALEAGKLSDALGIDVEQASRLMEVSGDLGVDMGALQGAMQRFNKTVGEGKVDLKDFGTELVYAKDGSVDSYESFINAATAIGAIEDPTKRASEAQRVFGRSYGEIAELMEMDAEDLRAALEGVSDAKVIDQDELEKSRDMRAAMDEIKDAVEDVQLQFGEMLVAVGPTLAKLVRGIGAVVGALTDTYEWIEKIAQRAAGDDGMVKLAGDAQFLDKAMKDTTVSAQDFTRDLADLDKKATAAENAERELRQETEKVEKAFKDADDALSDLKGNLDNREAFRNMNEALGELQTKIDESLAGGEVSWTELEEATDGAVGAVADYIESAANIPPEVKTELYAQLNAGDLDAVREQVALWTNGIDLPIRPKLVGQGASLVAIQGGQVVPRFDSGGVVPGPKGQPQLIVAEGGETVLPTHKGPVTFGNASTGVGGGGGITVNNYAANPNAIIAAIRQYERLNGTGWRR